ncbi:glycosyltransferase family 2 protein [Parasphingopyxis sp. CP4]|uniref:glycosyltransferase family 2 protein n=1 Tax=Parasphingopyxis sp. CP4 TaxID=2724527 RepID=UPI0015A31337|nr:glycosyltransferase family 2 protein [Parasphingopyxis sp. CP4]QLC22587.1 glycosyltransferase family 2 protein [Parasphingopyxis sp. CP4]
MKAESQDVFVEAARPDVSIVVPFFNEEETIETLCDRIATSLDAEQVSFEIILVDDGSSDAGPDVAKRLAEERPYCVLLGFRRNFGKAAALSAGFKHASGKVLITMDADLQDDPAELPRFLEQIEAGADVVCGWKEVRHDPLGKTMPSRLFNATVNRVFGLKIQDHNCGFKAYRREAIEEANLYGELHRFIPALLHARGYRLAELPVQHHPREHGQSKYGWSRLIKGALDLMTVALTTRYGARPLHLFGGGGLLLGMIGGAILTYLTILWAVGAGPIGDRPLLFLGMLLVLAGGQMIGIGLLAELILARSIREDDKYDISTIVGSHYAERQAERAKRIRVS